MPKQNAKVWEENMKLDKTPQCCQDTFFWSFWMKLIPEYQYWESKKQKNTVKRLKCYSSWLKHWREKLQPPKPTLNGPPAWNLGLWVKLPKRAWDKIKTLLFNLLRSGKKEIRLGQHAQEGQAQQLSRKSSATAPSLAAGFAQTPSPPREEEEGLGCALQPLARGSEHPSSTPQTGSAVKQRPRSPGKPHPQDSHVRGNWGGVTNIEDLQSALQTHSWGLAPEHCMWCKMMQPMQSLARDGVKLALDISTWPKPGWLIKY